MKTRYAFFLALLTLSLAAPLRAAIPVYGYKVIKSYPHDPHAFTEGLFYKKGFLYESTGGKDTSFVRKEVLATGKVLQQATLPAPYFGEGIVDWKHALLELTWHSGIGLVRSLNDLKTIKHIFHYQGQGWGLTRNHHFLYMSDGTATIRVFDPADLAKVARFINVRADGQPVRNINELEWVHGLIYANIWKTDRIAQIDPQSGHVLGWINLKGLFDYHRLADPRNDVPNGIAYDAKNNRLFVTGKCWPKLFEIRLTRHSTSLAHAEG